MSTKFCTKCNEEKEVTVKNFHKEKLSSDGFRAECRLCRNTNRRARREWADKKNPQYDRIKDLRRYKLTPEKYEEILQDQNMHCALCSAPTDGNRRLNIDHDHTCCEAKPTCGKCNRGLLCGKCNMRLGHLERLLAEAQAYSIIAHANTWLHRATVYLRKWREIHKEKRC